MAKHAPRGHGNDNGRGHSDGNGDGGGRSGPRAMWKGAVTFGLVTVPVALHAATERKNELSFRLLHAKDESPIDYKRFCEAEGVEVPWREIVKGYEVSKGRYVVVTDEDFEKARVKATQTFEIRDFVPANAIQDFYFDHPYYVAPAGPGAAKPYALLRDALDKSGRVGVGTIVMRQREHLAALEPSGEALVLTTMRWAYEIRAATGLGLPRATSHDRRELELALRLIETLASEWDPRRYKDTYRDVLMAIIQRKADGEEIRAPKVERSPKVRSLVGALEASLRERRPGTKVAGRRPQRRAA
jgi:DNA end-binding protein Ku